MRISTSNSKNGSFLFKNLPKEIALMQIYRVVPETIRGNFTKKIISFKFLSTFEFVVQQTLAKSSKLKHPTKFGDLTVF